MTNDSMNEDASGDMNDQPDPNLALADDESPLNGTVVSDTIPPEDKTSPGISWIEQFEALANESLKDLEQVVRLGLEETENKVLKDLSVKLIKLALIHDPNALHDVVNEVVSSK